MNTEHISFTTRALAGRGAGDSPEWTAQVLANRTVDEAEFCAAVGARLGRSAAEVGYIFSTAGDVLREFLHQGCRVNLSDVGFSLTLTGKFPTEDAAPDESRNAVNVCARATQALKNAFRLSGLDFVNVTRPLEARIFSVMDATLRHDGVICDGSRVLITGEGLRVMADAPFYASALHYDIQTLDEGMDKAQRHSPDVKKSAFTNLYIDLEHAGVGGVNSWDMNAIALPQYRVNYGDKTFNFTLSPVR